MRNALFFDIDGTLLSDVTGKIPDSALDALKKTIELGNLTFINTGRCYAALFNLLDFASVYRNFSGVCLFEDIG